MQEIYSNCNHFKRDGSKIIIDFSDSCFADAEFTELEYLFYKLEEDPFYYL